MIALMAMTQQAQLLLEIGQEAKARPIVAQALEAGAGGALQPFQRLLEKHPEWMREQLGKDPHGLLNQALLTLLPAVVVADALPMQETLSAREMAVLQLIAEGCSNQEISNRLFISLHTVKTHASHINSKLGVERRTQAVARAQELRLIG